MKQYLICHHSATKDGRSSMSWDAIDRWQREHGFNEIAYHAGFEFIDNVPVMLMGRPLLARAAGEWRQQMNRIGLHVMFTGNFDKEPPDPLLINFAARHLADLCEVFNIPLDDRHVIGHRDIVGVAKTCPGKMFDMELLRVKIRSAI